MNEGVQLVCQRRGCTFKVDGPDVGRVHAAAQILGWRHDGSSWWCHEHASADTLPSPAPIHDEETDQP